MCHLLSFIPRYRHFIVERRNGHVIHGIKLGAEDYLPKPKKQDATEYTFLMRKPRLLTQSPMSFRRRTRLLHI